jgi:hypothetical protein
MQAERRENVIDGWNNMDKRRNILRIEILQIFSTKRRHHDVSGTTHKETALAHLDALC